MNSILYKYEFKQDTGELDRGVELQHPKVEIVMDLLKH
jgi:hypothetical protein